MAQRLETTGTVAVVFEEIAIEVGIAEQFFGDEFIATLGYPGRAEIAAAGLHGDRHVGGLALQRRAGDLRIDRGQRIRVIAPRFRPFPLSGIAHHRPGGIVELEIAATGIVKGLDRRAPGGGEVREKLVITRIGLLAHHCAALPEMKRAGRRDRHLRRHTAFALQELEMLDMRMALEFDLAVDADCLMLGLDAVKLDPGIGRDRGDAFQAPEEIEMPPRAAEFAIGRKLEADVFLLFDDFLDLAVFDRLERCGVDLTLGMLGTRIPQRRRAQQTADVIGPERRRGASAHFIFPRPLRIIRRPYAILPTALPRPARCLPRSKRNRIAARDKADRARRTWSLPQFSS